MPAPYICITQWGGIHMYKKREFVDGAFYHVTSRTNNKARVFENNLGRRIMLITLQDAKDRFHFRLANFCIMPTHIHLLIKPTEKTNLSDIMHWIKIHSAKRWNCVHGSSDHLWGSRYFAQAVKNNEEYEAIIGYIDQNPVVVGLAAAPAEWKASGAFYTANKVPDLVDFEPTASRIEIKQLPPIPFLASNLLPPSQLEHIIKYYGAYATKLEELFVIASKMPKLGETINQREPHTCFRYHTGTADYCIYEYDGQDTMYGKVSLNVYPAGTECKRFSLANLKRNLLLKLEW